MKRLIIPAIILAAVAVGVFYFYNKGDKKTEEQSIKVKVEEGDFNISVTATGELRAKRSEKIRGPKNMRKAGIWRVTVADLVAEGTILKEGDYVGRLDRSEIDGKLQELSSEIEKVESQLLQTTLDTAIEMRGLRDQLVNLKYSMKEKELEVEQSKYEPPAIIQRVKLDLERLKRDYEQQTTNYKLKQEQADARVKEILTSLDQAKAKYQEIIKLSSDFTIRAPKGGMLIYERNWEGKVGPGSQISTWDPVVAQLPDLSEMISKTYVNEVDINKVKMGQEVIIRVDALKDQMYKGEVIEIANIGEQLKKFDAKVFEVTIALASVDSLLRPAMTTSNEIITNNYEKVLSIPLECIHTDSTTYVYKEDNGNVVKQEVIPGDFNENATIVRYGLLAGEVVLLSVPENSDDLKFVALTDEDRIAYETELAEEKRRREEQAMKAKLEAEKRRAEMEAQMKSGNFSKFSVPSGGG